MQPLCQTLAFYELLLPRVAAHEDGLSLLDIPRADLHAHGHAPQLMLVELPAGRVFLVEVHLHSEAGVFELRVKGLGLAANLALALAAPDRDYDRLRGRYLRWELQAPVVAVDENEPPDHARGKTPRCLVSVDPVLLLVKERYVEGAREVLSEVVTGRCLQRPSVAHEALACERLQRPGEALGGALRTGQDRDGERLVEAVAVDTLHLQGLLARLLGHRMDGVAFLPEELGGAQERARDLLPAHYVAPLVDKDGQVAVALHPVAVELADDALRGRPDRQALLEFLAPPDRHPCEFRVEGLDDLSLLLQVALRDEQREIGVVVPGRLEAGVEVGLDELPDRVPIGPYCEGAAHRPVVGELRHPDQLQVPLAWVLALSRKLLDRLGHPGAPLVNQLVLKKV